MSRKRKNELDELLRDAVKFMEWPTSTGPTSARIELPDDYFPTQDELGGQSASEEEEESSSSEVSRRKGDRSSEELAVRAERKKERKRSKRQTVDIYVPDKPLSPDSDAGEETLNATRLKKGVASSVTLANNNTIPTNHTSNTHNSSSTHNNTVGTQGRQTRLNLLSLVEETAFGKKTETGPSAATSAATSPKSFSVPVPIQHEHFHHIDMEMYPAFARVQHPPFVHQPPFQFQQPAHAVFNIMHHAHAHAHAHDHVPFASIAAARHPLLSLTGRHADFVEAPFLRGFLMGLPTRR